MKRGFRIIDDFKLWHVVVTNVKAYRVRRLVPSPIGKGWHFIYDGGTFHIRALAEKRAMQLNRGEL